MDYSDLDPFEHSSQRIKEYELSYGDKLSIDLLSLYRSQLNTDVTLVVQSKEFKVHRLILSTRSKYFNDLFQEHPDQYKIELAELFNLDAFQQIIEYIYSGQITVNTNTIDILLPVAEKLRLNTLCEFLGGFYGIELTDANVVSKLVHYHNINNKRGVQQCLLYIDHIITSNSNLERELSKLPFEILLQIVKRKTLDATEAKVLRLMVEWNKQRIEQGEDQKVLLKQMQQLASHLNIYLMCREDPRPLFEILKPNKWITDIELLWSALTKRVAGDNMYGYFNQDNNDPLYKRRRPAPKIVKQQKSSFKVAIFGLKNAGKTSVFKYFLRKTNPNIQQTTLMVEEFDFNGNTIQLRDFNGDEEVRKMWYSEVNKGLDGIIWVVDATDLHEENIDQINSVIDFIGKSIPVLLLAHKSDLGLQAVSPDEVTQFLRITKTMYFSRVKRTFLENYHIIASSITTDLLQDGMKWLVNAMIENIINNRKKGIVRKPI